jgi:translation initiation factor IF-2
MDALRAYSKLHESPHSLLRTKSSTTTDVSNVAGTEAGGITQMISAFQIPLSSSSNKATFLDTPGHAAFSQMRHCGLHATDILILVIAADDGVKEQTLEIIRMISASNSQTKNNIQLVIAMTKIDKPSVHIPSAIERLENELLMHGIETEGVGGTVPIVPVSGITSEGLDTLMNQISNCSQNLICTPPEEEGMGIVLDARVERGVGVVAECVVRSGHFRTGGYVVVDRQHGKIRRLHNVWNQPITVANPSDPIRLVGLDRLPNAGDTVLFVCNEKRAEELLSHRNNFLLYQDEETLPSTNSTASNKRPDRAHDPIADLQITNNKSDLHRMKALKRYGLMDADGMEVTAAESADDDTVRIPIIIKSDAHGTLHAVESALVGITTKSKHSLLIDPIRCAVGPINAADITLSLESDAPIFAFNVGKEKGVVAEDGVRIHQGNIIYRLIEDAKEEFAKFLPPLVVEHVQGSAKVQAVYDYDSKGGRKIIAGCRITDGILFLDKCENGQRVTYRVLRGGQTITSGLRAESLKKFKENVTQIRRGEECGLCLETFDAIKEGDVIECYITQVEKNFI